MTVHFDPDNVTIVSGSGGGKKGGGGGGQNTLRSDTVAKWIDLISEGPIGGLVTGDAQSIFMNNVPVKNADGTLNFDGFGYSFNEGTPDQAVMPGFASITDEFPGPGMVTHAIFGHYVTSSPNLDRIIVTMEVEVLQAQDPDSGSTTGSSVEFQIWVQASGGSYVLRVQDVIAGETSSPYDRSYDISVKGQPGPWDIKVVRLTADSTSLTEQNTLVFKGVTEVIDHKINYADSCIAGCVSDSNVFGSAIPARQYWIDGLMIQYPSNYDPVARTYTGLWDGTFVTGTTSNPAWILYALATNTRWGLSLPASYIDKYELYQVAQYCDELVSDGKGGMEPRFVFNGAIDKREDAWKVLQSVASMFRGILFYGAGSIVVRQNAATTQVWKSFSLANIIGDFVYSSTARKARHNRAVIKYIDPDNHWSDAYQIYEDRPAMISMGVNNIDLTAYGCTSRGQAWRYGAWTILTEQMETDTVQFQAGFDAYDVLPGDIIEIADPQYASADFGGRVIIDGSTPTNIKLDRPVTITDGTSPEIHLTLLAGDTEDSTGNININRQIVHFSSAVLNTAGTYYELSLATPVPAGALGHADFLAETVDLDVHSVQQFIPVTVGKQYTGSVYVKDNGSGGAYVLLSDGTNYHGAILNPGFSKVSLAYSVSVGSVGSLSTTVNDISTATITVNAGFATGDVINLTIAGRHFSYTVGATIDVNTIASDLAALIVGDTSGKFTATTATSAAVTVRNPTAGTFQTHTSGTILNADVSLITLAEGWYRVEITGEAVTPNLGLWVSTSDIGGVNSYAGDPTKGLFLIGACLNEGFTAADYVKLRTLGYSTTNTSGFTNLMLYSDDFQNVLWVKSNATVTADYAGAPGDAPIMWVMSSDTLQPKPFRVLAIEDMDKGVYKIIATEFSNAKFPLIDGTPTLDINPTHSYSSLPLPTEVTQPQDLQVVSVASFANGSIQNNINVSWRPTGDKYLKTYFVGIQQGAGQWEWVDTKGATSWKFQNLSQGNYVVGVFAQNSFGTKSQSTFKKIGVGAVDPDGNSPSSNRTPVYDLTTNLGTNQYSGNDIYMQWKCTPLAYNLSTASFSYTTTSAAGTITFDTTDIFNPKIVVGTGFVAGDIITVRVAGSYTSYQCAGSSASSIATGIAANLVGDTDANFAGTNAVGNTVNVVYANNLANSTISNDGPTDPMFNQFIIKIYDSTGSTLLFTDTTVHPYYTFKYENNAALAGGPYTSVKFEVAVEDINLNTSDFTSLVVSSSGFTAPSVTPAHTSNSVSLQFTPPTSLNYGGIAVWMSTTNGFTPSGSNLVYQGPSPPTIQAQPATTYYLRYAFYQQGQPPGTPSAQISVTTDAVAVSPTNMSGGYTGTVTSGTQTLHYTNGVLTSVT